MLSDERINEIWLSRLIWNSNDFARAIESAATAPLLEQLAERDKRIAELEKDIDHKDAYCEQLGRELSKATAELEAVRKDTERWKMTIEIGQDVLRHPDCRKIPSSVSAYMDAIHKGYDMTYAVDAAIDAAMKDQK